jgi:hypothetical protein
VSQYGQVKAHMKRVLMSETEWFKMGHWVKVGNWLGLGKVHEINDT